MTRLRRRRRRRGRGGRDPAAGRVSGRDRGGRAGRGPAGGNGGVQIVARAAAGAPAGGQLRLRRPPSGRRCAADPVRVLASRGRSSTGSQRRAAPPDPAGDTRTARTARSVYRWPTSPFGILGIFGVDPSVNDDGREKVYSLDIPRQAVNAGVVVARPGDEDQRVDPSLLSSNAPIHPWFLGSLDENDVLGYAGIPVNVERADAGLPLLVGASGGVFLPPGRYYVSVDSGRDLFTGRSLAGPYTLRSWVNDVRPPRACCSRARLDRPADDRRADRETPSRASTRCRCCSCSVRTSRWSVRPSSTRRRASRCSRSRARRTRSRPARSSCASSPPTSRRRRTSTPRARSPMPNTRFLGIRMEASSAAGGHLDHAERGRVPRGAPAALGRRERQRADLVGRLLRREPADRARPPERRRDLRAHLADGRKRRGAHMLQRGRLGHARPRGRGGTHRPRSAAEAGPVTQATRSGGRCPRAGRSASPLLRAPTTAAPRSSAGSSGGRSAATGSSSVPESGSATITSPATRRRALPT